MKKIILTFVIVSLFGCNEKKEATIDAENAVESNEITGDSFSELSSDFDRNCILSNIENFENILSTQELMSLTGESEENLSTKFQEGVMDQKFYTYAWEGVQAREAKMGNDMYPVDKKIVIGAMDVEMPLDEFRLGYIPTADVRAILSEDEVKAALSGSSDNDKLNKSIEKLREAGMTDEDILKDIVVEPDAEHYLDKTRFVEGYGNAAVWDDIAHEFRIHIDDLYFGITVDLHQDGKQDLAIAKKIADFIFDKCDK